MIKFVIGLLYALLVFMCIIPFRISSQQSRQEERELKIQKEFMQNWHEEDEE